MTFTKSSWGDANPIRSTQHRADLPPATPAVVAQLGPHSTFHHRKGSPTSWPFPESGESLVTSDGLASQGKDTVEDRIGLLGWRSHCGAVCAEYLRSSSSHCSAPAASHTVLIVSRRKRCSPYGSSGSKFEGCVEGSRMCTSALSGSCLGGS